ncbi:MULTISPECIES: TetR/AcrR family transcriptional regulator [Lysobacter]|jgi:AcrR family transcriptional regulator|uniref:TetR/AcrR family transcriptional regulator n=1 Tax=Lysobacter yananisis TaxID=1003114 RepID=A0ABY9PDT8_9GAMM|nr:MULTISPECIES: TetR/AcrR family transcriptional regulator [Lysobacter]QQQ01782.1 TetR/AcrR family transcriptional regulator [Lysobacter enzymogenes]WMT04935.1 TetR/AcrR family transcriptional regulator [Lysobacter yananisis]
MATLQPAVAGEADARAAAAASAFLALTPDPALDAAARLVAAYGVAALRLERIATAAGLDEAQLRVRFGCERRLRAALEQRFADGFVARVRQAMDRCRDGDWGGRLRAWVQTAVSAYLEQVALHDALFHDAHTHSKGYDRQAWQDNPVIDQLVELLEGGIAARVWAAPDPRMTAVIFFSAMHGAVDRAIACGDAQTRPAETRHRLVQTLVGHFERNVQWWSRF